MSTCGRETCGKEIDAVPGRGFRCQPEHAASAPRRPALDAARSLRAACAPPPRPSRSRLRASRECQPYETRPCSWCAGPGARGLRSDQSRGRAKEAPKGWQTPFAVQHAEEWRRGSRRSGEAFGQKTLCAPSWTRRWRRTRAAPWDAGTRQVKACRRRRLRRRTCDFGPSLLSLRVLFIHHYCYENNRGCRSKKGWRVKR